MPRIRTEADWQEMVERHHRGTKMVMPAGHSTLWIRQGYPPSREQVEELRRNPSDVTDEPEPGDTRWLAEWEAARRRERGLT